MIGGFLVWSVIYWAIMGAGLSDPLKRMLEMLDHVKSGKLDSRIVLNFPRRDELGRVTEGINAVLDTLEDVVINMKTVIDQVTTESHHLMKNVEQMSQGAAEQSAAAEETAASMEQMAANIRQNTENAHTAEQIALQSAEEARQGGISVSKTVDAMNNIENRVSLIQQIALQTHILSMNATIEAAKAQEYGKGFAVVASEVRALAGRSREAADEIESLVKSSVTISARAGEILQRLVPNSEKTAMLIQEIRAASVEQQGGTEQINTAVQQLDAVIQQNARRAEEMAAMSEKLAAQAEKLQKLTAFFTIRERRHTPANKHPVLLKALRKLFSITEVDDQELLELLQLIRVPNALETRPPAASMAEALAGIQDGTAEEEGEKARESLDDGQEEVKKERESLEDEQDSEFERF
jgi:methyl-accepting chemotaxis protein